MNLSAYFQRIAYDGPSTASLEALSRIAYRHALSIPFENLDPYLGIAVSLDAEAVAEKLVNRRRGGWCFEHNLLLGNALREMGFDVRDLGGRVVWRREADAVAARTHRVLQVHCDGRDWLVDAGFGGQTLTGVLELDSEVEQATPHGPFRLRRLGDEQLLETRVQDEWLPMYRFDRHPQQPVDFEAANFQLAHDPGSHFVNELIAALPTPEGRNTLRNGELAWIDLQGNSQRRQLESATAAMAALRDVFGIELAGLDGLEQRLARMAFPGEGAQAGTAARS